MSEKKDTDYWRWRLAKIYQATDELNCCLESLYYEHEFGTVPEPDTPFVGGHDIDNALQILSSATGIAIQLLKQKLYADSWGVDLAPAYIKNIDETKIKMEGIRK